MSAYRLYTGGPYKQRDGSAITSSSTDINGGSAQSVGTSENLRRTTARTGNTSTGGLFEASAGVTTVTVGNNLNSGGNGNQIGGSGGYLQITFDDPPAGIAVGNFVYVQGTLDFKDGVYEVTGFSGTTLTLNTPDNANWSTETNWGVYIIVGTLGATTDVILGTGRNEIVRDKVHRITALRTRKVATALRAGYWNIFTGTFSTEPTEQNDYASMDQDGTDVPDDEAKNMVGGYNVGGEFVYRHGGRTAKTTEYERRTT
jgi:hypothetical protein